jgi:hypothetical protein
MIVSKNFGTRASKITPIGKTMKAMRRNLDLMRISLFEELMVCLANKIPVIKKSTKIEI